MQNELNTQYAAAQAKYEQARQALEARREQYAQNEGRQYAETSSNVKRLNDLIAEQETTLVEAKVALNAALRESNAAVTTDAKTALTVRRNAADLIDGYQEMLGETSVRLLEAAQAADLAAKKYEDAWRDARAAYVEQAAWAALSQCGKVMAQAIAVGGKSIILRELERLAPNYETDATQTMRGALGGVDLGALQPGDRFSTAQAHFIKGAMKGGFVAASIDNVIAKPGVSETLRQALCNLQGRGHSPKCVESIVSASRRPFSTRE